MARNRVWLAWFVAAVMLALGGVARGQFTQHAGPMGQIVPARSVPEYATLLGLSDAQRDTLRALYEAYRLEYQRAKRDGEKAYQSAWNEMMEGDATEADANRAVLDFTRRVERAERAFFDDLRAILTPEQGTRFPKVERARRRDLGLRFAFASGANVDLLALCKDRSVAREGAVGEVLDRWEEDLDRALRAREATLKRVFEKAMQTPDIDENPALMQELVGDLFRDGFRVRDVNRRHVREIAALLPEDAGRALEREFRTRSFPTIYKDPGIARRAKAAKEAGTLTPETVEAIDRLAAAYARDVVPLNDRLSALMEEREEEATRRFGEIMQESWNPPEKGAFVEAWRARHDLDERTFKRLAELTGETVRKNDENQEGPLAWHQVASLMEGMDNDRLEEDEEPGEGNAGTPR